MSVGKSVRLFLVDGTPGALVTAEIMNWTGHVVSAPRSDLPELLRRPEVSKTGVYLLLGEDDDGAVAYVGEADDIGQRLKKHRSPESDGGKDFWNQAIVLTSKDANLTKAHARYLESRFIEIARAASRARLVNNTAPPRLPLPESDVSDMEYFIAQAVIVLPVLGVNLLRGADTHDHATSSSRRSPVFVLKRSRVGVDATAQEVDGEFTVLAGSTAVQGWGNREHGYARLRQSLERDGTLAVENGSMQFTRNQVFASPSAAAAVVLGRPANGRTEWKTSDTATTYGDWQRRGVEQATDEHCRPE